MSIAIDPAFVTGFVLAFVRAAAWIFLMPVLGTRNIPVPVKAGIAAALALAAAPHMGDEMLPLDDLAGFVGALVTQLFAGFALAFIAFLMFSVLQAAGSIIDYMAGFSMAAVYDPLSESSAPVIGRFYQVVATTLLFATGGHLLLVRGFLSSFDAVPFDGVRVGQLGRVLTDDLQTFMVAALEIAAPVIGVLFVTELALGVLARAAPQMNVFALGFTLRVVVGIVVVAISVPLLGPAFTNLMEMTIRQWASLS